MLKLQGTITALITPFKDDRIDEEGLIENIHFQLDHGIDGILLLGSTGESPTVLPEEQKRILSIAVQEVKGKVPIFAGTGTNCTRSTIEKTQRALDLGVDGVCISSPYYNKPTQDGIFHHFEAVASKVNIPILIYNIPGRTGVNIEIATLQRLAELPQIMGVKESSGNLGQAIEIMHKICLRHTHFALFSGDDAFTLPFIALGAQGVVSVVSNLIPSSVVEMVNFALEGNLEKARELHYQLHPLFTGAFLETNPAPIKEAMNLCGLPAGPCRLPLAPLQHHNKQHLTHLLHSMQLIQHSSQITPCEKSLSAS